ncbi:MAG: molybdenum cofactor guanylyltransferase [Terriglobia bacterium]
MPTRFLSLTGFVLAGGKSRRMGSPKHLLRLGGESLLERQLRVLGRVAGRAAVLAPPETARAGEAPAYPDERSGHGPLGGIYTGLLRTRTEHNLFLGCDLPFISAEFLRYLSRRALDSRADVLIPESADGQLQPLCAVYRRRARGAIRLSLFLGQNQVTSFFSRVRWERLPFRELARAGFASPALLTNVNTPEEYDWARRALARDVGISAGATAQGD